MNPKDEQSKWEFLSKYKQWILPIVLVLIVQGFVALGFFQGLENSLYDYWFMSRGVQSPGNDVVILAVDDSSVERIGPLAWPRAIHAQLLDLLKDARAVCFDLTFAAEQDPKNDQAFGDGIAKHGNVILSGKVTFSRDENGELVQGFEAPIESIVASNPALGFVNMATDNDGVVRRPTLVDVNIFDGVPVPCLGLAVALEAEDISYNDLKLTPGWLQAGKHRIPLDKENRALATFYGPMATFKTISYADVIEGKYKPDYFKNKIVLIGPETAEDHDTYPTPCTASNMVSKGLLPSPGVEIHASVVQNILNDDWLREVNPWLNFAFLFLLVLITALGIHGRGAWIGALGTLVAIGIALTSSYLAWKSHWWLHSAAPMVTLFITYAGSTAIDFIEAEMNRRKTKAMFSRYVSPDVVEQLMANPEQMSLGGKKQEVTILFTDIRGFTAFSENKDPVDVIARLNEYLTAQTDAILKHGGTLDKYMGDGLMAFFGAPIYYEDHVERAIKVAHEIQERVKELNEKWAEKGEVPLLIACGINTGPVVVGNVGSPERMDYTLIGEDANLASRVEALTKLFETLVLVSERSYNLLPEGEIKNSLNYVGEELVKGFTNPIKVYSFTDLDLHFEKSKDKGFK
ncbi:MAG: CHASE2 domain-containing protein [Deltaproteobacteria bacterium]